MEELVKTFHIDVKLILAQVVNFLIVLFVLKKFAYGPIVSMLEKRTKTIEDGLKNAEAATKKLQESEQSKQQIITDARKEAQAIIAATEEQGKKLKEDLSVKAQAEAEKILADVKSRMDADRDSMMRDIRSQAAELISLAVEKIIDTKADSEVDKKLIEKSLGEIN